ncbi:MAG TPA: rhomboid-like protein [Rugosimonospora sp.]|nr:rhomboid-like protein [Rugosimonospora sp.]
MWRRWSDRFGVAVGYTAAFAAGCLALGAQPAATQDRWLDWASTNLANLGDHPLSAMVCSAFLADADRIAWCVLALAGLGTAGWVLGAWRTAVLVTTAHVVGTLISEGILWARIHAHLVPEAQRHIRDVGPSYVVIAALAFGILCARWPGRVLCAIGFVLIAPGSFHGLPHLELSAMGHTVSVLVAAGLGFVMVRRRRARLPSPAPDPAP